MRKITLLTLLIYTSIYVFSVPVRRDCFSIILDDGRKELVFFGGDENNSWLQTTDGRIVEMNSSNKYRLTNRTVKDEEASRLQHSRRLNMPHRVGSQKTAPLPSIGKPKVPVVLVNFADSTFSVGSTPEEVRNYYDLFCNGTRDGNRYTGHSSYGSINDYFTAQSDGQFSPEFVIIGPVTLPQKEEYYGQNTSSVLKDSKYSTFRTEAITLATQLYDGDWMDFDNRGRGKVDMVFFIFAGCGENSSHVTTNLWPKESTASTTINGIEFSTSACCSEMSANLKSNESGTGYVVTSSSVDGIGVMCHELSHALGLPDFYNTSNKAFGMDLWSLMDYGCYAGGDGRRPCSYTAYEREFMGWRQIETIEESGWVTLTATEAGGKAVKIVNDENPSEYYVLENRQKIGWDGAICNFCHGLQVTHVDYLESKWNSNTVNSEVDHQRMTIIAANNRYVGTYLDTVTNNELVLTWKGNLYPFTTTSDDGTQFVNNSLTSTSVPAATVYTASGFMNKDINAIHENDDTTVSFYFGNDFVDAIRTLKSDESQGQKVYRDLSGRSVVNPSRRGVYIVDGRKVIVE